MDFLNKAFSQANELSKTMTPGARVTAGLLLAMIIISLVYLVKFQTSGPDAYLFGGQTFPPAEIPAMEAAFAKAGLGGYELEGTRFRIPRGQQEVYIAALADGGALPANMDKFFEESNAKGNIFETKDQQLKREISAKQRMLSMIIRSIKGIENAIVMYDGTGKGNLKGDTLMTASVSVKPSGSGPLDPERVPGIRQLVASSISGLSPEQVTVIDQNTGRPYGGGSTDVPGSSGLGDHYSERKRDYERDWQRKIQESLAFIPGVIVTTNVELDTETQYLEKMVNLDPTKAVPVDTEQTTTLNSNQSTPTAGRPGLAQQGGVNAPGAVGTVAGTATKNEEESDHSRQKFALGQTQIERRKHGLVPQRVTASIGVPSNYYETIWHRKNPAPAGQEPKTPDPKELETIQIDENKRLYDYVMQLIPLPPGPVPDQTQLVKISTFQHVPSDPPAAPGAAEDAIAWLGQYWSTVGMLLLGTVGLIMLRSMVQSARQTAAVAAAPTTLPMIADEPDESVEEADDSSRRKRRGSEPTMKDELVGMVREDPDAAANILRNWISNAG